MFCPLASICIPLHYNLKTHISKTLMDNQEEKYIQLKKKIEEKVAFRPDVRRHFDILSEKIFEATGEQVSSTTLRRFWGYQEADKQISVRAFTLDVLSHFVGYKSWADFETGQSTDNTPSDGEGGNDSDETSNLEEKAERKIPYPWIFCILLACIIAIAATSFFTTSQDHHYDFESDGLCYHILSNDSLNVEVTYRNLDDSYEQMDITIPSNVWHDGKKYTVTAIGDSAFVHHHGLIAIVLPPTMERIGAGAFKCCDNLTHINMPDGINEIGEAAMRSCHKLWSVRLPENINVIPAYCFSDCQIIEEVEIPARVRYLDRDAFGDCFKLKKVNIPDSLLSIGRGVFWNCRKLTDITIPASVVTIGDYVFWGCTSLKTVRVENPEPIRITDIFKKASKAHLVVPPGSAQTYSESIYWNRLIIKEEK